MPVHVFVFQVCSDLPYFSFRWLRYELKVLVYTRVIHIYSEQISLLKLRGTGHVMQLKSNDSKKYELMLQSVWVFI